MPTYHCLTCEATFSSERSDLEECLYCGAVFLDVGAARSEETAIDAIAKTHCSSCRQTFVGTLTDEGCCPLCGEFPDGQTVPTIEAHSTSSLAPEQVVQAVSSEPFMDDEQARMVNEESHPAIGSTSRDAAVEKNPQLVGIRGWLILPAIGCVLGPVIGVLSLIVSLALFSDVADAGYGGIFSLEILVGFGFLWFHVCVAIRFFGKRRNAPSMFITLLIASIVVTGLLLVIEIGAGAEQFAIQNVKGLLRSLVGAAIWIPYFKKSKRVKATFVH